MVKKDRSLTDWELRSNSAAIEQEKETEHWNESHRFKRSHHSPHHLVHNWHAHHPRPPQQPQRRPPRSYVRCQCSWPGRHRWELPHRLTKCRIPLTFLWKGLWRRTGIYWFQILIMVKSYYKFWRWISEIHTVHSENGLVK